MKSQEKFDYIFLDYLSNGVLGYLFDNLPHPWYLVAAHHPLAMRFKF
jgi:hypothetical protein